MTNTWTLIGATIFNIALNLAWIPEHAGIGAAWATVVCEITLIVILGLQSRKAFKEP